MSKLRHGGSRLKSEVLSQVGAQLPEGQRAVTVEDYAKMPQDTKDAIQRSIEELRSDPPDGIDMSRYQWTSALHLQYSRGISSRAAVLHRQEEAVAQSIRAEQAREERSARLRQEL